MILKRMKRRHLREDTIRFCNDIRKFRPDVVFGADIIAGFPTETDEMFNNTHSIIDEAKLTYLHIFPFSPRAGTPAAKMPPVNGRLIKQRAGLLRSKGKAVLAAYLDSQVGQVARVLMETNGIGRTEQFTAVKLPDVAPGKLLDVRISGHDGVGLTATPLDIGQAA